MHTLRLLALVVIAAMCGACSYSLKGRVIEGEASYVAVVDETDPRLNDRGLSGVRLHLQMDPGKLSRETLHRDVSSGEGTFELPVDEIGAGFMDYDVGLFARRAGYTPAEGSFRLPPKSKRILIVLARGQDYDQGEAFDNDWHDLERFTN
jgi:hypothetical protein